MVWICQDMTTRAPKQHNPCDERGFKKDRHSRIAHMLCRHRTHETSWSVCLAWWSMQSLSNFRSYPTSVGLTCQIKILYQSPNLTNFNFINHIIKTIFYHLRLKIARKINSFSSAMQIGYLSLWRVPTRLTEALFDLMPY